MKIIYLLLILAIGSSQFLNGQAYDGRFDHKLFIGYENVKSRSGIEVQYDGGLSDFVSYGLQASYVSVNDSIVKQSDSFFKTNYDVGAFLRLHISGVFKMSSNIDPYLGLGLGANSADAHIGLKYNFNEQFGLYGQYKYVYANGMQTILGVNSFFNKKNIFNVGVTINIF